VLLQPSGNIVVAGQSTLPYTSGKTTSNVSAFGAVTYNPDGSLDTAFGSGGIARQMFQPVKSYNGSATFKDAALEPTGTTGDDKILLVGGGGYPGGLAVMRLNANGSLDTTFGNSGRVVTVVNANDNFETADAVVVTGS